MHGVCKMRKANLEWVCTTSVSDLGEPYTGGSEIFRCDSVRGNIYLTVACKTPSARDTQGEAGRFTFTALVRFKYRSDNVFRPTAESEAPEEVAPSLPC